jgi:hypothetical protein
VSGDPSRQTESPTRQRERGREREREQERERKKRRRRERERDGEEAAMATYAVTTIHSTRNKRLNYNRV